MNMQFGCNTAENTS